MEDPGKAQTLMWSPASAPSVAARRMRNAASMQAARSRETPEATLCRREQNAVRMEMLRTHESQDKASERRAKNAAAMQAARARETPQQTAIRRAQNAARMGALRARETPDQRALRRSLNAARMQASRAKEALQETASSVGIKVLIEDEVMRKAVLATHRQPLKKRKDRDITMYDSDQQQHQMQQAVAQEVSTSTQLPHHNGEGASKFSFQVN